MLNTAVFVFGLVIKLFSFWFLATSILFWKKPKPYPRRRPQCRFACVIPARNEERVIGDLVKSLRAQDYPGELFDIYVVPNNCTDATWRKAAEAGARILRCCRPVKNKGDALHQALGYLMRKDYDAFCVFDADNLVSAQFLSRMNDAILAGAGVAKGRMVTKNPVDSWVAGCYAIYNGVNELIYNRSRASQGLSAKLVGTGFAVSRHVLEKTGGWRTVTLAEDAEYSAVCAEIGEKVWWVPEAVTFDEAPRTLSVSLIQRKRWCGGIMDVSKRRLGQLIRALPRANAPRAMDSIVFFSIPFVQAFSPLPVILGWAAPLGGEGGLASVLSGILCGYAVTAALGLYVYLRLGRPGKLFGVLMFPVFMFTWIPLQITALVSPVTSWREIKHFGGGRDSREQIKRFSV